MAGAGAEQRLGTPQLPDDSKVPELARAFAAAGGRALVVGGWVRDQLLARADMDTDIDLEVQGLSPQRLEEVLGRFGRVHRVGRAFPIHLVEGLAVDVCLPRTGDPGPDGSPTGFDPALDFTEAARGRDLRVNAMAWDPLTDELLDPHGGRDDLQAGVLRATDALRFGNDPVRGLRTARLSAVLEMEPDAALADLCAATDLSAVAPERVLTEIRKLLLEAARPSRGFAFLRRTGLLRFLPELAALIDVPQDPQWHPEGDVWVHTLLCLDRAAGLRVGDGDRDLLLMLGVLCHDLGKASTTERREDRILSRGHDAAGVALSESLLAKMRAPNALVRGVTALVRHHLAPASFARASRRQPGAGARGYRRLLRKLRAGGVDADLLWRVARADHLGRTTEDAARDVFAAGDAFLARAQELEADVRTFEPVVTGRYLLKRGVEAGPALGEMLDRCRAVQDETGSTDPAEIFAGARARPADEPEDDSV